MIKRAVGALNSAPIVVTERYRTQEEQERLYMLTKNKTKLHVIPFI